MPGSARRHGSAFLLAGWGRGATVKGRLRREGLLLETDVEVDGELWLTGIQVGREPVHLFRRCLALYTSEHARCLSSP